MKIAGSGSPTFLCNFFIGSSSFVNLDERRKQVSKSLKIKVYEFRKMARID